MGGLGRPARRRPERPPNRPKLVPSGLLWGHVVGAIGEASKQASNAPGPGYTATQPPSRSAASVKPPHSIPMVGIPALPAASASYGVSPIATAFGPSMPSFFNATRKMSGAGLDCSAFSDEIATSTRSLMQAIPRYTSSSLFLAEDATATCKPA